MINHRGASFFAVFVDTLVHEFMCQQISTFVYYTQTDTKLKSHTVKTLPRNCNMAFLLRTMEIEQNETEFTLDTYTHSGSRG